ncbi:MAG TPA: iron-regulated protein [Bacteroidales bacterium]|nr:MAG: hypothetical protein A2X11_13145 [Bacteroidetes bacterium GWE2_42_24]OFY25352.1 MAG: hypothetical protein A2X09_10350 [Bacteroidetes bacterium GWF2_43_11]PKP26642.1 MAG: iron-regulated protein [Bacteroidetes bacterium HGW-Bacteroidetes-22]HAQ64314.1 iron-regulated protein [Bacteroidales bacterium]HBZ67634.1 iron-regulated protein [Bacteroidales bacterium]
MKNRNLLVLFATLLMAFTVDKPAYQFFSSDGKPLKYTEMMQAAASADVILFGELHNNPVCHWLQLELTRDIFEVAETNLVLGAEMFETDNQLLMSELMAGKIRMKDFENEAKLWPNYKTDYKPLLAFAVEKELNFVATNVPRRYAAMVNMKGFETLDSLSPAARAFLAPLPVPYDSGLKSYKDMQTLMGPEHTNPNLPKAQALKDATMAWSILQNLKPGQRFIHFNGTYHSDDFEGIVWYLNQWRPGLKIVTISSVSVPDPEVLPDTLQGKATFILALPERMTTSQ